MGVEVQHKTQFQYQGGSEHEDCKNLGFSLVRVWLVFQLLLVVIASMVGRSGGVQEVNLVPEFQIVSGQEIGHPCGMACSYTAAGHDKEYPHQESSYSRIWQ